MLQLKNRTPFAAAILPLADAEGVDTLVAVVKATFALGGERLELAEEQLPVTMADEHYGEPPTSSIRRPSDVCLGKPATDVVLLGSAWAPGARPTWHMDVSVSAGPVAKSIRVFADRVWDGSAVAAVSWVEPFVRMPLVWERAFGGTDTTERGPAADARNPVGRGFRAPGSATPVHGLPLPNLEDPGALITSPRDAPTPAGLAPLGPHWEPRRSFAGTYDEGWQRTRAPFLPADFSPRFFQIAPPGLIGSGHFRGGELVDVRGATPGGLLQFHLPTVNVHVSYKLRRGVETRPGVLDTILLEPDENRLGMVWRAALPCDKQLLKVEHVETTLLSS